ncbi:MAG: peptidoglycan-binding protein, partial [Candidatus Nomurabacteria bacterium]
GLFVAVANSGTGNRVMTSTDGISWTTRTSASNNDWQSVTYGNGMFVAVSNTGTGDRIMSSLDGVIWTSRASLSENTWSSVTYGNGKFVAISNDGTSNNVLISSDGITWRNLPGMNSNQWSNITYGNGMFVAVSQTGIGNRVMTSQDGSTWTSRSTVKVVDNTWRSVAYGDGVFVAVANSGVGNRVMSSSSNYPSVTPSNGKVIVSYTLPDDLDLNSMVVLMSSSYVTDSPASGITYVGGESVGSATVACADTSITSVRLDSCIVSGLTNGTSYYFKVFAKDNAGNYSSGLAPVGSPVIPTATPSKMKINSYRFIKDIANQSLELTSAYSAESTPISSNFFIGDSTRLRFNLVNEGTATTIMQYQIQYSKGDCTTWTTVPNAYSANSEDFRIDPSSYVANGDYTTHNAVVSAITAPVSKTFVAGTIQTLNNATPVILVSPTQYTEIEYLIRSTPYASPNVLYCFRLTNSGDETGFNYTDTTKIPKLTPGDRNFRPYAGGGGAVNLVQIEAPASTATTTVTGGGAAGGAASTTDATSTPAGQKATTTPGGGGGGGGDVGLLKLFNSYAYGYAPSINSSEGMVLGASTSKICTNLKHRMFYGVDDTTTQGEVSQLQYYLRGNGYFNEKISGYYGVGTREAVKQFQTDNNLIVTGITGRVTRGVISKLGCLVS